MIFVRRSYAGVMEGSCSSEGAEGVCFFKAPICEITDELLAKFILIKI